MTLKDNRFDVSRTGAMMLSRLGVRAEPEHMYAISTGAGGLSGVGVVPGIITGVGYSRAFRNSPASLGIWPSGTPTNVSIVLPWGDSVAVLGALFSSIAAPVVWDKSALTWVSLGSSFAGVATGGFTFDTNKIAASFMTNNSPRAYAVAYYNGSTWTTFGTSTGTSLATRVRGIYGNNIIYDLNGAVRIYDIALGASASIPLPSGRVLAGSGIEYDGKFWINVRQNAFPNPTASIYYWNGSSWTDTTWQGDTNGAFNQDSAGVGSMGIRDGLLTWLADSTLYESNGSTVTNTVSLPYNQHRNTAYCTQMLVNRSPDVIAFVLQLPSTSYWVFEFDGTTTESLPPRPVTGYSTAISGLVPLTGQLF